jgi:hypothetical protein
MIPRVTLREALSDPNLLGTAIAVDSWRSWRTLLIAAMGEELTADERLSESSGNDLAMVLGAAIPGQAPPSLINLQQVIGLNPDQRLALPEREDKTSNPIQDASHVLEAFEHLTKSIKAARPRDPGKEENRDDAEAARPPLRLLGHE